MSTTHPILLDTDIGSDIDDALALLLLLHLQEVEIVGITTVYGNVGLRAKIARQILQAAGRECPVHAGTGGPMSTPLPIWHTNLEGIGVLLEEEMAAPLAKFGVLDDAPGFIAESASHYPGQLTVLAIGALTNVAIALDQRPGIVRSLKNIVFMGAGLTYPYSVPDVIEPGTVYHARASHNIRCDIEAARRVFESGVPIRVLTNDVTTQIWWEDDSVQQLIQTTVPPEAAVVGSMLKVWLEYRTAIFNRPILGTCPHDPLTTAEAVYPGRFVKYARGRISVCTSDGATDFVADSEGPHEIGVEVDSDRFLKWFSEKLIPSCGC